jgi:hypothetical protein
MKKSLNHSTLVKIYELDPIEGPDKLAGPLRFRIEVWRRAGTKEFFPQVFRHEVFRLQPTCQGKKTPSMKESWDYQALVKDDAMGFACDDLCGPSVRSVLDGVVEKIQKQLRASEKS